MFTAVDRRLMSLATVRRGLAVDATVSCRLRDSASADTLLRELNTTDRRTRRHVKRITQDDDD
jgi:hypothetical protein